MDKSNNRSWVWGKNQDALCRETQDVQKYLSDTVLTIPTEENYENKNLLAFMIKI